MKTGPIRVRTFRWQWLGVYLLLFLAAGSGSVGVAAERLKGSPIWFGTYLTEGMPADASNLVDIASQQFHTIALRENGEVLGWGGGLGGAHKIPAGLPPAKKIAAGYYFGMALLQDGTVRVWGAGGHVSQTAITTPPPSATNVVDIAAGMDHCLAVRGDGSVIAWGNNIWGQLDVPSNLTDAVFVAGGQAYSIAVTSSTKMVGWGHPSLYNPGSVPTAFNSPSQIFMGPFGHSVGLNADGRVFGWGDNSKGQSTPPSITNGFAVAAGSQHSLAAFGDGLVQAYGDNTYGQGRTPPNFPKVFRIAAGDQHSVGLTRAPVIVRLDADWSARAGDDALLDATVLASDAYQAQWFLNGSPIAGAHFPRWRVPNIQVSSAGPYELIVSNEFGFTRSGPVQFNVEESPLHWTLQPTNAAAFPGSTAEFSAEARGTEPKGYQWYHEGKPVEGGTTNRLVLNSVTLADEGSYYVIATNSYSTIKSAEVRLVVGLPVLLRQPLNQRARSGWNLQLEADVLSASNVSLQWFHNGIAIDSATNLALPILSLDSTRTGRYQLRVTNAAGEVWSREATVELLPDELLVGPPGIAVVWGNLFFDHTAGSSAAVDLVQTAVGKGWLAGLHADGKVEIWGDGGLFKPALASATNIIRISAGLSHIIGLRRDGTVVGIGQALPENLTNIVALSAGEFASIFAKRDGTIMSVGAGQPAGISNVVAVAAGTGQHMAVLADGRVLCWSRWGQFDPYFAIGITNAIAASGGEFSSFALLADGTVASWEHTSQGPQPATIIPGVSNVVEIAYPFGLARLASGEVIGIGGSDLRTIPYGLRAASISASLGLASATSVLPFFDTHPVALQVYEHGATRMTANVRGPGILSYQWFKDNLAVPGATNSTIEITDAAVRQTGLYKLRASNAHGSAESLPAQITVLGKPEIISQPAEMEVVAGRDIDLAVSFISAVAATFVWEFEGIPIPDAATNSLRITNAQSGHAGTYQVLISNSYGTTTSLPIRLKVRAAAPFYTLQPASLSVRDGENAEFMGAVIGTAPIAYQWFHEETAIPGATSPLLQINNVQAGDAGRYHLLARNSEGSTLSDTVFLLRTNSPPLAQVVPPFRLAREGRTGRFDAKILAGSDTGRFTFQWKHAGTNLPAATNSWLIAAEGGKYSVEVSNAFGAAESHPAELYLLPARTPGVVRTWGGRATVQTPNGLVADEATQGLNFGAAVLPDGSVSLWGSPPGGTNTPADFKDMVSLAAADSVLFGLRNDGRVLVLESSGVSDFGENATNLISLSAGSGHALALRADGSLIGWGPTNLMTIPVAATNIAFFDAAGSRNVAMRADGVFISWGPGTNPALTNTPAAASNVVVLAATTRQNATLRKDGSVVVWGGPGAPAGNSNFVALVSGQSHLIALRKDGTISMWGANNDNQITKPPDVTNIVAVTAGTISSHAIVTTPRVFTADTSQTVAVGNTFTLRSFAVGSGTLSFQWFLNNSPVADATSSNLTLTATSSNFGTYTVVVSNEWTSIKSANYSVNLGSPPAIIREPISQIALVGSPVVFMVEANGSGTLAYQWMLNGTRLVGATSQILTLSNVFSVDSGAWTVRVTNSFGSAESMPAILTVGQYATNQPSLHSLEFNSGELSMTAAVESNAFYRLLSSTNLKHWEDLKIFVASSNLFRYVSPSPTNTQRFYRLVNP